MLAFFQTNPRKAENFDKQFKDLPTALTPPTKDTKLILRDLRGDEFAGFDHINNNFTLIKTREHMIPPTPT